MLSASVVFYTDNRLDRRVARAVQDRLWEVCPWPIVSVSLGAPIELGHNIVFVGERGYLTMFRQQLAGVEAAEGDYVFLCEHDVLYHPTHFDFQPVRDDVFYYNVNNWKVDLLTGRALYYLCHQTLGLCANRKLLLEHYRARVERVEREGRFNRSMGFEPGDHQTPRGVDDHVSESWQSAVPNIDIRHGKNLTQSRWSQDQFRDKRCCTQWQESDSVPGWGNAKELMDGILAL